MNLLEVRDVTIRYGGSVLAVEGVTFDVEEGGAVALLGANGAGKTSILRAIGGLLSFHRGQVAVGDVRFAGASIVGKAPHRIVGSGLAQALEGRRVFPDLTVTENLTLGAFSVRSRSTTTQREIIDLFPRLGERLQQTAGTLSGGEQQMLAIGRALMARPRLLVLDEPSLGLAPLVVEEIGDALTRVAASGLAVLLVDQNTTLARRATRQAHLIESGRIVASGDTEDLLSDGAVRASYLGMATESI